MLLSCLLRDKQDEKEIDRTTIRRIEGNGRRQAHERTSRLFEAFYPAMGNRNTLAQTGGAQFFASKEAVKDR